MNVRNLAADAAFVILVILVLIGLLPYAVAHRLITGEWPEEDYEEEYWE